jgi:hypothetical protein
MCGVYDMPHNGSPKSMLDKQPHIRVQSLSPMEKEEAGFSDSLWVWVMALRGRCCPLI